MHRYALLVLNRIAPYCIEKISFVLIIQHHIY
jgi:hypothetical protein